LAFPVASGHCSPDIGDGRIQCRRTNLTEFTFPHVSAESSGDYFQVSFEETEDSEDAYFLIQRQFESCDGGLFYLESHDERLCGHFKIGRAVLGRDVLRLEVACEPPATVQIRFQTGVSRYNRLKRIPGTMMSARVLTIEEEP